MKDIRKGDPGWFWKACTDIENGAKKSLSDVLKPFDMLIRDCYESGIIVPTLSKELKEKDILLSSFYLKRVLTDLRSIWLLISIGYTSQAASVASSLFENALAVSCIAGSQENSEKVLRNNGDLPWSVQNLVKMYTKKFRLDGLKEGEQNYQEEYEIRWREVYSHYKWLCKIKHPTLRSLVHECKSTTVKNGLYVIMAAPDLSLNDLSIKIIIITVVISRVTEAIRSYIIASGCDNNSDDYKIFNKRIEDIISTVGEVSKRFIKAPLPFTIRDSKLVEEYAQLRRKKGD